MNAVLDEKQPQEEAAYPLTTAALMERMFGIRNAKADLDAQRKALDEEYEGIHAELMRRMNEQGSKRIATDLGMAILTKTTLPVVEDWEAFYDYIKSTDAFHLLQRRVSAPAYRELLQAGESVPGVGTYEETKIQLRSN